VTQPEWQGLKPKKAEELSEAHGEGPAEGFVAEGTRRFLAGKELGRVSLLTFFARLKKVRREPGAPGGLGLMGCR